jgi:uncharacterized membrane protein
VDALWHLTVTEDAKPLPHFLARRVWNGIFVAGDRRAKRDLALISSVLFLGDHMTPKSIVGGLLAISGVAITQVRSSARPI